MQCDQQLCLHSCCLVGSTIQRGNFLGIFILQMRKVFPSETLLLSLWQVPSCVYSTPAGIDTYSCLSPAHQGKTEVEKAGLTESWHKWPCFCLSFSTFCSSAVIWYLNSVALLKCPWKTAKPHINSEVTNIATIRNKLLKWFMYFLSETNRKNKV